MAYTCTCTCQNCALIRAGDAREQQTSWFERNSSPWNLVKVTLFVTVFSIISFCASPLVILAGGTYSCMLGEGLTDGIKIYTNLWAWFIWLFTKKFLRKWCPSCSSSCQIENTKILARRIIRVCFERNTARLHQWDFDATSPLLLPPPPADQPCKICHAEIVPGDQKIWESRRFERCGHGFHPRCLIYKLSTHDACPLCAFNCGRPQIGEGGSPPPPPAPRPPQRVDQPCTICIRIIELVQGDLDVWEYRRFERCGHGYHSSCLMLKLVEHDTCPVCTFDNRHLVGNPRGLEGTRIPEDTEVTRIPEDI